MRLELRTEGGVAAFPGLALPFALDTTTLPPDESARADALVEAAGVFDGGGAPGQPGAEAASAPGARGHADARRYVLTVTREGRSRTLVLRDPVDTRYAPLLEFVRAYQRKRRARR